MSSSSPESPDLEAGPAGWPMGRLLSAAARTIERQWDERLREIDLTHAAVIVLDHVVAQGERSAENIAQASHVQPQTMSKTLDRMERDGLVERLPDPSDRRRRIVRATAKGRESWNAARHLERDVLPDDPALRAALVAMLTR